MNMNFTAPLDLVIAIKTALWEIEKRRSFWDSTEWSKGIAASGWAFLTDVFDAMESQDRRLYHLERHMEPVCRALEIPIRWVMSKPRSRHSDAVMMKSISAVDAAALMVTFQGLGFRVDPVHLIANLLPGLANQQRLSQCEYQVVFYEKSRGRLQVTISTTPHPLYGVEDKCRTAGGYRARWMARDQSAVLHVRGPSYRKPKARVEVTCEYCGQLYTKGDLEATIAHRQYHTRVARVRDPLPHPALTKRWATDARADVVTASSPKWAQKEIYERAVMFKREFGYDFIQWSYRPGRTRSEEEGTAYLLTPADQPNTVAGACVFRQRSEGWTLDWAWIAPRYRRSQIMQRYWPRFLQSYGDFELEHPLSDAMRSFVLKYGSHYQQAKLTPCSAP